MKSRIAALLFMIVGIYIIFNRQTYKDRIFYWDATGYYVYLPAVFIYHDLGRLSFYPAMNHKYNFTGTADAYGMFEQPTGRLNNKYAVGTALFEMPLFLLAHAYCTTTHACAADGYTTPYQFAGILSCILWVGISLFFLRAFLLKHYTDNIAAFVLVCVGFGTNIYCYGIFNTGMSHPYGFVAVAGLLYATDGLYDEQRRKYFVLAGLFLGLVFITRPVNILVAIVPLFWQVYNWSSLLERLRFWVMQWKNVLLAIASFFVVASLQLGYWKYTTGQWLYYSYQGERFNFMRPHVWEGLFSYQKGWLLYTPMVLVAFLALLYYWFKDRRTATTLIIFFVVMIYVVFCWEGWWYGGGFSARALIETLPLLSVPLAFIASLVYQGRALLKQVSFSAVIAFLIVLNMFQSYQYAIGTIHYMMMNEAFYWRVFGKVKATPEDYKLLKTDEEFAKQSAECFKKD